MKLHILALATLFCAFGKFTPSTTERNAQSNAHLQAPDIVLGGEIHNQRNAGNIHQKRDYDTNKIFNRKRNAHACIMSIVFIVLYPLGAISIHLPVDRIPLLKNSYLRNKVMAIHAPIQIIGFIMTVGGMALGIRIAHDLGYLQGAVPAHVIIGLLVACTIIAFQPILGMLQHRHFKRTGGKSIFGYLHRWIGRVAIILGMINNGLGFQLAEKDIDVPTSSYIRNFVLLGVLVSIWFGLVLYDMFRAPRPSAAIDGEAKDALQDTKQP